MRFAPTCLAASTTLLRALARISRLPALQLSSSPSLSLLTALPPLRSGHASHAPLQSVPPKAPSAFCSLITAHRSLLTSLALCFSSITSAQPLPEVSILATNPVTSEGDHTSPARFSLARSGSTADSLAVNLHITGTATPGADYLPIPSPITIPSGQAGHEIVIFPYQDNLAEGAETIVLTVDSGTDYTVTCAASATAMVFDTQFDVWKSLQFTPAQGADPAISGPAADPDADSHSNLGEFFAGSDPLTFDLGPTAELVEINGQLHLSIRRNPAAWPLNVTIDASDTPSGWEPLDPQPYMNVEHFGGWDFLTFAISQPGPGDTRRFWRARINETPAVIFDYYVDAVNGSDLNDGRTADTAFQTIAATQAVLTDGTVVGLARGSTWREMLRPSAPIQVGSYGAGDYPILDAADIIPPGNFTLSAHPDAAGVVYQTTLTRDTNGRYRGADNYMMWENGEWLLRRTSVAACAATPGTYYPNPIVGASTTAYVHPFGSTNPTSDGKTYEAAIRSGGFEGYSVNGLVLEGFGSNRNLGHYGGITAGRNAIIRRCLANRGGIHNIIAKSGLMEDVVAFDADPSQTSKIPITFYEADPSTQSWEVRRCIVSTPGKSVTALYSHGSPNPYARGTVRGFLSHGKLWNTTLIQENNDVCCLGGSRALQFDKGITSAVVRRLIAKTQNNNSTVLLQSGGSGDFEMSHSCVYTTGTNQAGAVIGVSTTGNSSIKNNTIYSQSPTFAGGRINKFNIYIWDSAGSVFITVSEIPERDYNVYIRANTGSIVWRTVTGGTTYTTIESWRAASGKDLNSVLLTAAQGNDLFLNGLAGLANGDFRLNPACALTFVDGTPLVGNAGPQEYYDWNSHTVKPGQPARWPVPPVTEAECQNYIQSPKTWNFYP